MTPSRTARALFACLAAGSLVVAGCSDDEPDAAPATTQPGDGGGEGDGDAGAAGAAGAGEAAATTIAAEAELYDVVGTALKAGSFRPRWPAWWWTPGWWRRCGRLVRSPSSRHERGVRGAPRRDPRGRARRSGPADDGAHLPRGQRRASRFADLQPGPLETLAGIDLTVTRDGDTVMINDVEVTAGDIEATNGLVHVVDGVLVPPT